MFDFTKEAKKYYSHSRGDDYPRLRAWDYLWDYMQSVDEWADLASNKNIRNTALNIGFYLANWGMFRGSSGLPYVNLRFFEDLTSFLFTEIPTEFWNLTLKEFKPENTKNLEVFDEGIRKIRDFGKNRITWTQTLTTKLLLGIWGQCPAFDTYFSQGFKKYETETGNILPRIISARYLIRLNELRKNWPRLEFKTPDGNRYPMGKVIDMAFFQYGADIY